MQLDTKHVRLAAVLSALVLVSGLVFAVRAHFTLSDQVLRGITCMAAGHAVFFVGLVALLLAHRHATVAPTPVNAQHGNDFVEHRTGIITWVAFVLALLIVTLGHLVVPSAETTESSAKVREVFWLFYTALVVTFTLTTFLATITAQSRGKRSSARFHGTLFLIGFTWVASAIIFRFVRFNPYTEAVVGAGKPTIRRVVHREGTADHAQFILMPRQLAEGDVSADADGTRGSATAIAYDFETTSVPKEATLSTLYEWGSRGLATTDQDLTLTLTLTLIL